MTIFLIGYMASGKTTLGRALAREMNMQFIDLDFYITQRYRKTIPEIFASKGEEGFRQLERNMLLEAGSFTDTIVSCGGGTPCFFDNMDFMNENGVTIFLDASPQCIARRLLVAKTRRPIVEGKSAEELPAFIEEHMKDRRPFYERAKLRINSDRLESREEIAATIAEVKRLVTASLDSRL